MKRIKRESNLHLWITKQEKQKYNAKASDIGLSLSAFVGYSMTRTSVILNQVKREV